MRPLPIPIDKFPGFLDDSQSPMIAEKAKKSNQ
jgi:hypothetical protein